MNLRSVVALADENVTTVDCRFHFNVAPKNERMIMTFKCSTEMAKRLKKGDFVLADMTVGIRALEVVEVHGECQIDPEDGIEYRWVFDIACTVYLDDLKTAEEEKVKAVMQSRRQSLRRKMRELLDPEKSEVVLTLNGKVI